MKPRSHQLRTAPQVMFRIVIVIVIIGALSMLADPTSREGRGAARSSIWSGGLAAWAGPAPALPKDVKSGMRARTRCAECGVIESSAETATPHEVAYGSTTSAASVLPNRRTITVRLADGSRRVIGDAMSARWRVGERVIVIGGLAVD